MPSVPAKTGEDATRAVKAIQEIFENFIFSSNELIKVQKQNHNLKMAFAFEGRTLPESK